MYDLGARNYDPTIGRFVTVDPKSETYQNQSPYAFAVNNPAFFVDINGEGVETDYKVIDEGKIVRADPNDGSEKNANDRIVKVKNNGTVKPIIENIAKGIITEGMNMRTDMQLIAFGGENQPKLANLVDFLVQYSENISYTEITGFEGVSMDNKQSLLLIEPYLGNTIDENKSRVLGKNELYEPKEGSIFILAHFHTHQSNSGKTDDINKASIPDRIGEHKRNLRSFGKKLPHYIYNVDGRIDYN